MKIPVTKRMKRHPINNLITHTINPYQNYMEALSLGFKGTMPLREHYLNLLGKLNP